MIDALLTAMCNVNTIQWKALDEERNKLVTFQLNKVRFVYQMNIGTVSSKCFSILLSSFLMLDELLDFLSVDKWTVGMPCWTWHVLLLPTT